jgi:hypothetical protein
LLDLLLGSVGCCFFVRLEGCGGLFGPDAVAEGVDRRVVGVDAGRGEADGLDGAVSLGELDDEPGAAL